MRIVNAYTGGREDGWQLILVHPDGSRTLQPSTYDYFLATGERISCRTWKDRDARVRAETRPTREADLSPVRRFLADNPDVEIAKPRRVWLDLETDPTPGFHRKQDMRIIVACCKGEDGAEFTGVLPEWSDVAEGELISRLFAFLKGYDVVCAWNGGSAYGDDGFDFPILRARVEKYWPGASRRMSKWGFLDHLKAYRRLHLLFAETGEERASYSLDNVAKFVLGEGKHEYDAKQTLSDWQAGGMRRNKLVEYCRQDVALLPRIEAATGVLDLAYEVARLCGCLHDSSGLHPTTFVDSYLLRLAGQRGLRLPTKPYEPNGSRRNFAGAFVFEPTARGIEKNIFSADMASLYPSVYIMLNASPETKGLPGCVSPQTGVTFAQDPQGIMPAALTELGKLKKHWKDEYKKHPDGSEPYLSAKRTHDAVKSCINSVYGYGGSKYARLYDKDIAESITLTGQFFIKTVAKEVETRGWSILQGDTDSAYVKGATEEQMRGFLDYCNTQLLPGIARAHHCKGKAPVLEFDAAYERMVVLGKKRYVGRYVDSEEYIVRGLECRRGDASPLARQLQEQCIRKLMVERSEDPEDFVFPLHQARDRILTGEIPREEIVMSESIRKDLSEYEVTNPAVSAARVLQARGEDVSVGTRIKYVVLDGSVSPVCVIPAADFTGEFDRFYVWENLVYPPTQRLLAAAFPDYDWEQFAKVRPAKARVCAEVRYQAALEKRGQLRLFSA